VLYICPTPIGNLRDITLRVLDVLRDADLVVCEDTRRTRKLLSAHGLRAELFSFFEPREDERLSHIVGRIEAGEEIALVTDAGMPGFSDPGFRLVRACVERGLPFTVLPGPSAVDTAVVASGFPVARFVFVGFLPRGAKKVVRAVELADRAEATVAAYESPRRLPSTLRALAARWPDRQVAVCRELTKVFEEVIRGSVREVAHRVSGGVKGEIVLVLAPVTGASAGELPAGVLAQELMQHGIGARDTARLVARVSGLDRRAAYDLVVRMHHRLETRKAVIFDMDGVLIDSESVWMRVLREVVTEHGGVWVNEWANETDPGTPTGDSSLEWSGYLVRRYGVTLSPERMVLEVTRRIRREYERALPLIPEAVEAVHRLSGRFRLGLASSSPRELIQHVLEAAGLSGVIEAAVSSDEVDTGKPAPDVYRRACSLLGVPPAEAVAVEDTGHGLRAAKAAGMRVVLVPSGMLPLDESDRAAADVVLESLVQLTPELLMGLEGWESSAGSKEGTG
jgi:16S rRNA (cytidine1402-2'-O)-methyltransferase